MHNSDIEQKGLGTLYIHFVSIYCDILGENTQFCPVWTMKNANLEDFWKISAKNTYLITLNVWYTVINVILGSMTLINDPLIKTKFYTFILIV